MGAKGQRADSVSLALDSRIGVRKHAVLRTAMRGNERSVLDAEQHNDPLVPAKAGTQDQND
jgi:hypothetical protein